MEFHVIKQTIFLNRSFAVIVLLTMVTATRASLALSNVRADADNTSSAQHRTARQLRIVSFSEQFDSLLYFAICYQPCLQSLIQRVM